MKISIKKFFLFNFISYLCKMMKEQNNISNMWEHIEVKDPSREACIIYVDDNGVEEYREYFGINVRIEYKND